MAQPSDALEHDIFIHYHKKVPLFVTAFLPNKEKTPFEEAEPIGRGREFESRFPLKTKRQPSRLALLFCRRLERSDPSPPRGPPLSGEGVTWNSRTRNSSTWAASPPTTAIPTGPRRPAAGSGITGQDLPLAGDAAGCFVAV